MMCFFGFEEVINELECNKTYYNHQAICHSQNGLANKQ